MAEPQTTIDLAKVNRGMNRMAKVPLVDSRDFFADMKKPMNADQSDHSRQRKNADGTRWKRRAPSTIERHGRRKVLGKLTSAGARKTRVTAEALTIECRGEVTII